MKQKKQSYKINHFDKAVGLHTMFLKWVLYLRQMTDPTNLTYCVQADEIENKTSLESIDTLFCISQSRDI